MGRHLQDTIDLKGDICEVHRLYAHGLDDVIVSKNNCSCIRAKLFKASLVGSVEAVLKSFTIGDGLISSGGPLGLV